MRPFVTVASLLLAAPAVRANPAPPPTLTVDFLHLDFPYSLIAGLSLTAAAVSLFFWLRRRNQGLAVLLALVLFIAGNLALYLFARPTGSIVQ